MAYSHWVKDAELLSETSRSQALLLHALRENGASETRHASDHDNWQTWTAAESQRRANLTVFVFLNLQTIFYNSPPVLFSTELAVLFPCSSLEWEAATEAER